MGNITEFDNRTFGLDLVMSIIGLHVQCSHNPFHPERERVSIKPVDVALTKVDSFEQLASWLCTIYIQPNMQCGQ